MTTRSYFSADYAEARRKFRDAAQGAGARVESRVNPASRGPAGEALATDVAWLGPADAARVLVTISGTHGAEGFAGAGIQTGSLMSGVARELPQDTALLAIHAINPYGFAWMRRVTEGNVDLNRNFVAHDRPLPENAGYVELADAVCYGGRAPSWSRRTLLAIAAAHLGRARHVAIIDYHTGLGPWGHGERIVVHRPGSAALARARDWYGADITSTALGTSTSSDVVGDGLTGLEHALDHAEVTGMALECGVRPMPETLDALRADNWLHMHGRPDSAEGREIKAAMRAVFYGDADDWKDSVFAQGLEAQRRAIRGLQGEGRAYG